MSSGNDISTTEPYDDYTDATFPICDRFWCEKYFTPGVIVNWAIIVGRVFIAVIILLLGTKITKDFMRSITFTIFVPIAISELFTIYCESMTFATLFLETQESAIIFQESYLVWTPLLKVVMDDYIHYNSLIMSLLLLHCCHISFRRGDAINPFPVNTLCLILQIIPFFLCVLIAIEGEASFAVKIISVISRLVTIVAFAILTGQIFYSFYLLTTFLPYNHSASNDMQLRDAKSRLAWTLFYMVLPYTALLPFFVESVIWILVMGKTDNVTLKNVQVITEVLKVLIHYYRPTWLVVLTMICLPPYRRAVPLLFCCGKVKVQPLPRKQIETSFMYKHAD